MRSGRVAGSTSQITPNAEFVTPKNLLFQACRSADDFLRRTITVAQEVSDAAGRLAIEPPKTAGGVRTLAAPAFVIAADTPQDLHEPIQVLGLRPAATMRAPTEDEPLLSGAG